MNRNSNRTVFEKMRGTRIPDYYGGMYKDSYQPWEILEAAHNSIINEADARQAEREPQTPMNVKFRMEVIRK